jgi:two-component system chemotaxis response regulator CheB
LISTVKLVARIRVITHPRGKLRSRKYEPSLASTVGPSQPPSSIRLIALGASTGGPRAALEILEGLRADFPVPLLFVIHIGRTFAVSLADWLDGRSPLRVAFARDGERLPAPGQGRVILAPADHHLVVEDGRLWLTKDMERHSVGRRRSLRTIARELRESVACLLTGMGRDGAVCSPSTGRV